MEAIKDTVQTILRSWEVTKKSAQGDLEVLFRGVFSKRERAHVQIDNLRKGTLNLRVDSSSWLYHLGLKKEDLLSKLRKKSSELKDIRFYLGEISAQEKNQTR